MFLCLGLLGAFASPAAAGTVTSASDTFMFPAPGELRYEIMDAGPGETVDIAPGVDPVLSTLNGDIEIDKNLTLEGQGASATSISTQASNIRIFDIPSIFPAPVVTIRDLTMTGGNAGNGATGAAGGNGGAIRTSGDLTLNRVRFTLNLAGNGGSGTAGTDGGPGDPGGMGGTGGPGGFGGAVFNTVGGVLTVTNSTFDSNFAGSGGTGGQGGDAGSGMFVPAGNGGNGGLGRDGGAIHNTGGLTVTNSTFFNNRSGSGGNGGDRGAGFGGSGGDGGDGGTGGAIHQGGAGSVALSNSTLRGNVASQGGFGGTGVVPMLNGDPGADGAGGGTFFFTGPSAIVVANTIYSQNVATTGSNCAGPGTITSMGANLSFPAGGGCPGSFSNGDPQLAALADNGGPTETMALGAGSAAINQVAVGSLNCPGADQRGIARPQGPSCDIGAFELEMAVAGAPPATPPAAGAGGTPFKKKCKKGRKLKKGKCVRKKKRRKK